MAEGMFNAVPDPYALENRRLERRRALAQSLIQQGQSQDIGQGYQGGKVYIVGNPLSNVAASIGGNYLASQADQQQSDLDTRRAKAQTDWQGQYAAAATPAEKQAALTSARNQGLRYDLEKSFYDMDAKQNEAEAARIEAGEQAAANRVEAENKAIADRDARAEEGRLNRQNRLDLRAVPTVHVSMGGAGGGDNTPGGFGGPSTVVGIDPRTDAPVYRHTKSGQLFRFDEGGQSVPHAGAIGPKPAAAKEPTESERSSAGYLGRMEATEKNLGNAQSFGLATQKGLDKAPSLTNYALSPQQQVQRQQQEDWVRAKLRKESGAVIGEEEMAREIRTYFPMAGDSKEVIVQKAQSRAQALEQIRSSSGRAKPTTAAPVARTIVREVKLKDGRIGVEYNDGSRGFK